MAITRITSAANPILKTVKSLKDKKGRKEASAFLMEGLRLVDDGVSAGADILYFVASDGFMAKSAGLPDAITTLLNTRTGYQVPDELMIRLSDTDSPQGIMAVAAFPQIDRHAVFEKTGRYIVMEAVQDPGNVGTIIRTAEACGFEAVLMDGRCADPYQPKVVRATMGSLFRLPVVLTENLMDSLFSLKKNGIPLAAAHLSLGKTCWEADLGGSLALIVGNEANGLSEEVANLADRPVRIPMLGKTESLNAASAAAILLYESMRQKSLR